MKQTFESQTQPKVKRYMFLKLKDCLKIHNQNSALTKNFALRNSTLGGKQLTFSFEILR